MTGLLCLQGGREFTPDCREMDAFVLERVGAGPVGVLAGAARIGRDYEDASQRAQRHYESLGAVVRVIPDPRVDLRAALAAMASNLSLVVLPGGSPRGLRDALSAPIADRLSDLFETGTSVSGSSAGAMVVCARMVRPDGPDGADVVDGLGLAPGLALPHWSPERATDWPTPDDLDLWGLPECGGALITPDGAAVAVGHGEPSQRVNGEWRPLSRPMPG